MQFRILGSLEAEAAAGGRLALGGPAEQTVLAVLLLSAGHVVPVAHLIDALWEDRPPATAVKQARNAVGRVRRLLAVSGEPDAIATEAGGYRIRMEGHGLDARDFEARAGQAEAAAGAGDVAGAAALLRGALELWRGPALAGLSGLAIDAGADAWNERRWAAQETYFAHRLALGEHGQIIGDLRALVCAQRLREGPAAQLMVALHRCGRRAEALQVYQRVRAVLAEELGLDPGPQLCRLHQQILAGEAGRPVATPGPHVRLDPADTVLAQLREALGLRRADQRSLVVNLAGPLGVGKSEILAALNVPVIGLEDAERLREALLSPPGQVLAVDNADGAAAATLLELLAALPRDRPATPVIVAASRRPLRSLPGWTRATRLVTVTAGPWPDTAIDALASSLGIGHAEQRELVVRLSAGIPLITDCLCRCLHAQPAALVPAAMADAAAREILARLRREDPCRRVTAALGTLASAGHADEELLQLLEAPNFAALAALSIVTPAPGGMAVAEPYRTMFDLARQWRQPLAHRSTLTRAAGHTRRLLAVAPDRAAATDLVRQQLFLTGDPLIRQELFPAPASPVRVRPMAPGEEDIAARLVHNWARRRNLNQRNCTRMLESWLGAAAQGLHFACTQDGAPTAMINTIPVNERTTHTLELLLQRHTGQLTQPPDNDAGQEAGVFAGFLINDGGGPVVQAALLQHTLAASMLHGRILIATPWSPIEALCRRLGFTHHGETRHDVYACGAQAQIFSHRFAPDDLPGWLDKLGTA